MARVNVRRLLSYAVLLAVSVASGPASAQSQSNSDISDAQQRFFEVVRRPAISGNHLSDIRGIIGFGYLNGQSDLEIDARIADLLGAREMNLLEQTLGYDPGAPPPGFSVASSGVVHGIQANFVTLTSGTTVLASNFFPGRDSIKPGIRIGIDAQWVHTGLMSADAIAVFDEANDVPFKPSSEMAGGRFAKVISTTRSNAKLEDGKTVFFSGDTIFAPDRALLSSGSKIMIYGVPTNDGNINADRVEIL